MASSLSLGEQMHHHQRKNMVHPGNHAVEDLEKAIQGIHFLPILSAQNDCISAHQMQSLYRQGLPR